MEIKQAISDEEKNELDKLLWNVLWKPLGFARDIRQSLKLNTPQIELIAVDDGIVVGGLVANWLSKNEIEIRHVAVKPDYQRVSIGRHLIDNLVRLVQKDILIKIQTYARTTSAGFFAKAGFMSTGKHLEHQDFVAHGIKFQQMCLEVPQNSSYLR